MNTGAVVLLLCAVALPFASAGLYGKKSNVITLSTENFATEVFSSNDVWIVEFYAPWCGHCKQLAPHWEAAATKLKGLVKVAAVDCDVEANKQLAGYFEIKGFPTIKVFPGDFTENPHQKGAPFKTPVDYQGQRTTDAIVQAAMGYLKYYGEKVDAKNVDSFVEQKGNKVLLLSEKKKTTGLYKALSGHFNGRLTFGQATTDLGSRFNVETYPALIVLGEDGTPTPFTGKLSATTLTEFLEPFGKSLGGGQQQQQQQKQTPPPPPPPAEPVVHHLESQADFDEHCSSGICVVAFLNPEHDTHDDVLGVLQKMSEEYLKYFKIMWLDGMKFQKFSTEILGSSDDLPRMVVLSPNKKLYTPFVGSFTESSMKNFLGKVLHGKKRSVPLDNIPAFA